MSNEVYLTPDEVEERYRGQITLRTLRNWRSQGKGPPFTKIGGGILYSLDQLMLWEKKNTINYICESVR